MYHLLSPKTLAAIIAELQVAQDQMLLMTRSEVLALDAAETELASNVGPDEADRLIAEAYKEVIV